MSMDNRIFNVNGAGQEMLLRTLKLAFEQAGTTAKAFSVSSEKGLILYWFADKGLNAFPTPLDAESVMPMVWAWLNTWFSDKSTKVKLTNWDENIDHDGSNSNGWRVYCEDWGHVDESFYAIVAITPAYMWYGK